MRIFILEIVNSDDFAEFWIWKSFSTRFDFEIFKINFSVILDFDFRIQFSSDFAYLWLWPI